MIDNIAAKMDAFLRFPPAVKLTVGEEVNSEFWEISTADVLNVSVLTVPEFPSWLVGNGMSVAFVVGIPTCELSDTLWNRSVESRDVETDPVPLPIGAFVLRLLAPLTDSLSC